MHPATIGPFKIERELGRGGMGEVYLAQDTRLDRQVAIKALPAHLSSDPDRLARFQREAKVLASLNHPSIGAIYGLEEANGHQYLILEFVEGETLGDRLAKGPIAVDEALSIAKQIAEALEIAHEKGVIHRDLKPGNVMVTPDGVVKVLDFGLARTADAATPSSTNVSVAADSPTVTSPARYAHSPTIPGVIMGTAGYMSPEQARGKPVDKRSDIFSFGCVLYEMLTGAQPFRGETVADAIGATLHKESDLNLLPPGTPRRVRELLTNCLAKDKKNRLHDIGDARLELERAITGQEWASAAESTAGPKRMRLAVLSAACVLALVAGGIGWLLASRLAPAPVSPPQPFHLSVATPPKPELNDFFGIAPDGRFIIYRVSAEQEADSPTPGGLMMVRRLDSDKAEPIPGTEGVLKAALSPDGRWVAFISAKDRARSKVNLKKVALVNGQPSGMPEALCELPATGDTNVCWSSDREIALAQTWNRTLLTVPASGGEPRVVFRDDDATGFANLGEIRPLVPGQSILASRWKLVGEGSRPWVEIVELASGKRTMLLENAERAQYLPTGHIIARRNRDSLIAARFDLATQRIIGEPVTVWNGKLGGSFFVSPTGALAVLVQPADITGRTLAWIDEQGRPVPVGAPPRAYRNVNISPDGGRVVTSFEVTESGSLGSDLWIYDFARRTFNRLPTPGPAWDHVWSNDGQRIAHNLITKDELSIWERRADGSGEPEKLFALPRGQWLVPASWSPDGKTLAVTLWDLTNSKGDVLMLEKDAASGKWIATPYLNSPANEGVLRFSPDGKWVRFIAGDTGRNELYVQRFSGAGAGAADARSGRVQISTATGIGGGVWWSPDGKEIRFLDSDLQTFSVQIQTAPTFSASLPKPLYSMKDLKPRIRNGDFAPDGRLMVIVRAEDEGKYRLDVIVNFVDEMRAKVDAAK